MQSVNVALDSLQEQVSVDNAEQNDESNGHETKQKEGPLPHNTEVTLQMRRLFECTYGEHMSM